MGKVALISASSNLWWVQTYFDLHTLKTINFSVNQTKHHCQWPWVHEMCNIFQYNSLCSGKWQWLVLSLLWQTHLFYFIEPDYKCPNIHHCLISFQHLLLCTLLFLLIWAFWVSYASHVYFALRYLCTMASFYALAMNLWIFGHICFLLNIVRWWVGTSWRVLECEHYSSMTCTIRDHSWCVPAYIICVCVLIQYF